MTDTPSNLSAELVAEIQRVIELRGIYQGMEKTPGVNVKPVLAMINASISGAMMACAKADAVEMIRALENLRGFEE